MTKEQALALANARLRGGGSFQMDIDEPGRKARYAAEEKEADRALYSPTVGMSTGERLRAGYGGAIPEVVRGIRQRMGLADQKEIDEAAALEKPLLDTTAGAVGRGAGIAVPAAGTAVIPGANTVLGSGVVGGLVGAVKPTVTGGPTLSENVTRDTLTAGAGSAAVRVLPTVLKSLIDPFRHGGRENIVGGLLNQTAGSNRQGIQQAAGQARSSIPGASPTLAEATQDPGIASLALAASSGSPEVKRQLTQQAGQNTAARLRSLEGIAGDEQQMGWARGIREMMTELPYKEALETTVDKSLAKAVKPQIDSLTRRPAMKAAIAKAKEIFGENDIVLEGAGSAKGLQLVKQALDDMIEKSGSPASSIGKNQLKALQQTRSDLISTIETLVPKLRDADTAYAQWSKPINQMQIGGYLRDKMVPALMDFSDDVPTRIRADSYAQAMRNAGATVKSATGRTMPLEETMSGGQMSTLNAIGADLARTASAQDLAKSAGSPTVQNLAGMNVIRQFLGPMGMPQGWAEKVASSSVAVPVTRMGNLVYSGAEKRIQEALARALRDPQYAAQVMAKAGTPTIENAALIAAIKQGQQGLALTPAALAGRGE